MGAVADHVGNVTPVAEYNMWADPHAVDVVLRSGLQLEFVGWDISRFHSVVDSELAAELRAIGTPAAEFCIDINAVVAQFCATETKLRRVRPSRPDHDGVRHRPADRHRRRGASTWRSRPRATSPAGWW